MVIYLERGADLHMAQLMPLPLIVSCFSKIQIGFTFLVPTHPGSPGKRAVKRVLFIYLFVTHEAAKTHTNALNLTHYHNLLIKTHYIQAVRHNEIKTSIVRRRPEGWNSLLDDLRTQRDYESFRQGLKTWLFSRY